jgi:twitching motility two-component system response regulator PilH
MLTSSPENKLLCIIAESDQFLARLLQRFAEKSGLRVQIASTGEEMLELLQNSSPALIILEPELPGKTRGWEATRAIRTNSQTSEIPLIACAWLDKEDTLALTGPLSAYLKKPDLHFEDFAEALLAAGVETISEEDSE